nr:unnamed protein product [Callosobruchus chinensis]
MISLKIEQRINLKFLVKLGKSPSECFQLLKEVFGDNCMSRTRVFEWHKRFSEGREEVEDDERTGRPVTSRIEENIKKVNEIVRKDRRLSLRMISDLSNIDRETVRKILHEDLKMTKVCAKMVPKNLTPEQKENRKNICIDIMQQLEADPGLLEKVVTCDETWIFQYDPETKRQSMHWKTQSSPRMKKARMSKSKLNAMLIIFFDVRGVIMVEWVPQGQTVNQKYYIEVLEKLRESEEEKTRHVEKQFMDFAPGQRARSQCALGEAVFSEKVNSSA